MTRTRMGIIGGGAWGSALSLVLDRADIATRLWVREEALVAQINKIGENTSYLPGVSLPEDIDVTNRFCDVSDLPYLFLVAPAQHMRFICQSLKKECGIESSTVLVICAKGIECHSTKFMHEIIEEELPEYKYAILSGPNLAMEIAHGLPAITTIASQDASIRQELSSAITSRHFRAYQSDDVIGVSCGGAVKNVLAIACGMVMGQKLGENALSAIITRGLVEINKLSAALGGKPETALSPAVIGDTILTCQSRFSRNTSLGIALGEGASLEEVLKSRQSVTEGVPTTESVCQLAQQLHIDLPICEAVRRVLYDKVNIEEAVGELLNRPVLA